MVPDAKLAETKTPERRMNIGLQGDMKNRDGGKAGGREIED
jgi:hypothetical protein